MGRRHTASDAGTGRDRGGGTPFCSPLHRTRVDPEGDANRTNPTLYGATVADNVLRGAPFQYGYVVDGVGDGTVAVLPPE